MHGTRSVLEPVPLLLWPTLADSTVQTLTIFARIPPFPRSSDGQHNKGFVSDVIMELSSTYVVTGMFDLHICYTCLSLELYSFHLWTSDLCYSISILRTYILLHSPELLRTLLSIHPLSPMNSCSVILFIMFCLIHHSKIRTSYIKYRTCMYNSLV